MEAAAAAATASAGGRVEAAGEAIPGEVGPRSTTSEPGAAARAASRAEPGEPCRAWVTRDLTAGVRHRGEREALCASAREAAQRRLLRSGGPRPTFGVVERRIDESTGVTLLLSVASRCWRWPLRAEGRTSPSVREAVDEGCKVRRYTGPVAVTVVDEAGARAPAIVGQADAAGRLTIDFAAVDGALRVAGRLPLLAWSRLEIGAGGWGGSVDLAVLRAAAAERHADAVRRGRGVPALFVVAHADHPEADAVRLLAAEAQVRRQGADYQAVVDGRFPPRRFLERHAISRFRQAVEALELEPAAATVEIEGGDAGGGTPSETAPR